MDISLDPFYSQPSQFMFGGRLELNQQTAPQTPQTPSSIPDIVLQGMCSSYTTFSFVITMCSLIGISDFSCTPEELARHNSHDLSSAMGSSFEGVDFYPTDDALRGDKTLIFSVYNSSVCVLISGANILFFVNLHYRWTRSDRFWRLADLDKFNACNWSIYWRSFQIGSHVRICSPRFIIVTLVSVVLSRSLPPVRPTNPSGRFLNLSVRARITVMISALSCIF